VICELVSAAPLELSNLRSFPLNPDPNFTDLWTLSVANSGLVEGRVYHYWFEVTLSHPERPSGVRIQITDPTALGVDWRVRGPRIDQPGFGDDDRYPASIVRFVGGQLSYADPDGDLETFDEESPQNLPANNRIVIYELPTTWTRSTELGGRDLGVGTFADVLALIDSNAEGENFADLEVTQVGQAYLLDLGINALELLPPADSIYDRQWGYGTTNYLAPDFELGFPLRYGFPAPNRDLGRLVNRCHQRGVRFFVDVVMAFAKNNPYLAANCDDFFILHPCKAPDSDGDKFNSRGNRTLRDGFGASLFRYARFVDAYDPISGTQQHLSPANQLMKTALTRWQRDFRIDGLRLDSIENVANWDFVQQFKDLARALNRERFQELNAPGADERFLVVGEELSEPQALLTTNRLDGLWHESFKHYVRQAILGQNHPNEPTFEATVRKAIDCRSFGYSDLAQAVIYLTSHDVEGFQNERIVNFCFNNGVMDAEKRVKLAFACLLTAVGVPMILAGDEFADQHDLFNDQGQVTNSSGKQVDPVNFTRLGDDWRLRIKTYVSRLIQLRTSSDALAVNDVSFLHVDFNDAKRVLVWQRGVPGGAAQVVVVANFSDYVSPGGLSGEYVVPNFPAPPAGKRWQEVPRARFADQAGREPIFPWEAKVYTLVAA
jgi:1,4-alpha-glucan branching enzyme